VPRQAIDADKERAVVGTEQQTQRRSDSTNIELYLFTLTKSTLLVC
jgi:hypothetical protein